jgi:hypothetical protein
VQERANVVVDDDDDDDVKWKMLGKRCLIWTRDEFELDVNGL